MSERTDIIVAFEEKFGENESFPRTLPELCFDLRMSTNGAADPWDDEVLRDVTDYLQARLDHWHEPSDDMDNCVWGMCVDAILTGRAELADRASRGWHLP